MSSNADFLIGVSLVDATADPIVLEFQQELCDETRIALHASHGLFEELGTDAFAEHITDYYLSEHLAEVQRVGREAVLHAVRNAIKWGKEDAQHPQGLL